MSEPEPDDPTPDLERDDADELRSDPVTGSTEPDPEAEESGPPPAGDDPMGGPAPSG